MKILCVHAHFDDFEFVAAGTFELWRRRLGSELKARILVCTDGAAGHHFRTRKETAALRLQEQAASAKLGGYEFELLKLPDGNAPREAFIQPTGSFLAALWKSIREFEPDYLFCPPLPSDPLAGVHVDHWCVAEAVRKVAYLLNVPHAFTPEYPADETRAEPRKTPVILNVHDGYMSGSNLYDLVTNVEPAFDLVSEMAYCHQCQIKEWIPWVGRHQMAPPENLEEWKKIMRGVYARRNKELGFEDSTARETFAVTAWGEVPSFDQLQRDLPGIDWERSSTVRLKERLARWS